MQPDNSPYVADAFWARVLGETGVIGLAGLLVFCRALIALELWRATRRAFDEPIVVAFVLGAWMVFVQGLVETAGQLDVRVAATRVPVVRCDRRGDGARPP